jgi:hypothetical protein
MDGVSSVDRHVFRYSVRWAIVVMLLLALAFALLLPVAALLGYWPAGPVLVVVVPVVLLPLIARGAWYGLIRPYRVEFDSTGLAVVRGGRRFALPWSEVHGIAVVRDGEPGVPRAVLVAWPITEPAPGSYASPTIFGFFTGRLGSFAPAAYDRTVSGFLLADPNELQATDHELAAAVERYAPGLWGSPVH